MIAPSTRVLVLTISDQDADVIDAILAGACGYLLKDAAIEELMAGIRAAAMGESLVSPAIASKLLQRVRATHSSPRDAETIRSELSDREIQVLKLIANGKDNGQIAADLHISPKTVKNHISNILMKLQKENRIQAAVYAVAVRARLDAGSRPSRACRARRASGGASGGRARPAAARTSRRSRAAARASAFTSPSVASPCSSSSSESRSTCRSRLVRSASSVSACA